MQKKKVTIAELEYEVREITIGQMLPIMPRLSGDEATAAQLDIVKQCVFVNGQPLGEAAAELGLTQYLELAEVVMEVNGLTGKD